MTNNNSLSSKEDLIITRIIMLCSRKKGCDSDEKEATMPSNPNDSSISLKLLCGEEIRRVSVPSSFSFPELEEMTCRLFSFSSVVISWEDDEEDIVVISSDDELSEAFRVANSEESQSLRLHVSKGRKTSANTAVSNRHDITQLCEEGVVHEGVVCNRCNICPIIGSRYKCTVREEFNLCQSCEESGEQPYPTLKLYSEEQAPSAIVSVVNDNFLKSFNRSRKHRGITCCLCRMTGFTGARYQCTLRKNFNLCEVCESKEIQPFSMLKLYQPNMLKSVEVVQSSGNDSVFSQEYGCAQKERHPHIRCCSCGQKPIVGPRYVCSVRSNYNLCESCEEQNPHLYPMMKIYSPSLSTSDHLQIGVSKSFEWLRNMGHAIVPHTKIDTFASSSERASRPLDQEKRHSEQGQSLLLSQLSARLLETDSVSDVVSVYPHSSFVKIWRVQNDGDMNWPEGCHLISDNGDFLVNPNQETKQFKYPLQPALCGQEIDISVELFSPRATGSHIGYFRLEDPSGNVFGPRLHCDVHVMEPIAENNTCIDGTVWEVIQKEMCDSDDGKTPSSTEYHCHDNNPDLVGTLEEKEDLGALQNDSKTSNQVTECSQDSVESLWESELSTLSEMGFHDVSKIIPLLQEHVSSPGSNERSHESEMQTVVMTLLTDSSIDNEQ